VPVHVRSAAEYVELLKKHAFENVAGPAAFPTTRPRPTTTRRSRFIVSTICGAFKTRGSVAADGDEARSAHACAGIHDLLGEVSANWTVPDGTECNTFCSKV